MDTTKINNSNNNIKTNTINSNNSNSINMNETIKGGNNNE